MNITLLLITLNSFTESVSGSLNFIGKYIGWLIAITGSVGIGIILFTLTLRLISLAPDIISRVGMKKNALKMEMMRPELEKLQKQYANNKDLYNQKMMALYKKNGYSMFGACLPTIFTLVFFIIAINAFNAYAKFSVINEFNAMTAAYNAQIDECIESDTNGLFVNSDGIQTTVLNEKNFYETVFQAQYGDFAALISGDYASRVLLLNDNEKIAALEKSCPDAFEYLLFNEETQTYSVNNEMILEGDANQIITDAIIEKCADSYVNDQIYSKARESAKVVYETNVSGFLWIKNIWRQDVSYVSPFPATKSDFDKIAGTNEITEGMFNEVSYNLTEAKSSSNGFYILVVLSIASIFLSTFISQKMQKAQTELQSVDGQAAQTQKIMMWIVPIMFGYFSFQYSAAFSVYMVVSTLCSMISTILINLVVERSFKKKIETEMANSDTGYSTKKIKQPLEAKVDSKKKGRASKDD